VALASLAARQIDLEVEYGDLDAAARASELIDAFDLRAPGLRNIDLVHPARARWLLMAGRADQARALLQSRLDELQHFPDWMPETARIRLLMADIDALQGRRTDAMQSVSALLALLQADGALNSATHSDAVALRAELLACGGAAVEAAELLAADETGRRNTGLGAASVVQRAEWALRAAGVQRHAGAMQAAQSLLLLARDDLASQHASSPRLARLAQALHGDGMPTLAS
jgi:hypothetical protein